MNLNLINKKAIQAHTKYVNMSLFLFSGQTFSMGVYTPTYADPIIVSVNVQLYNNQKLSFENDTLTTTVYKKLFIDVPVSGLNRGIGKGGDYLIWNKSVSTTLKYRVIEVINEFPNDNLGNTSYTEVIAVESILLNE